MTAAQLLDSMSSEELVEWQIYFRLEAEEQKRAEHDAEAAKAMNRGKQRGVRRGK